MSGWFLAFVGFIVCDGGCCRAVHGWDSQNARAPPWPFRGLRGCRGAPCSGASRDSLGVWERSWEVFYCASAVGQGWGASARPATVRRPWSSPVSVSGARRAVWRCFGGLCAWELGADPMRRPAWLRGKLAAGELGAAALPVRLVKQRKGKGVRGRRKEKSGG